MSSEIERILAEVEIRELPRRKVCVVGPETALAEAYRLLDEEASVALLIRDDTGLTGIFTERDVVDRTALEGDRETPIGELMSPIRARLTFDDRLADAIELMHQSGYRHIPLEGGEGGELGLVGGRDILKLIAGYYPEALLNLPPRLHQVMTRPEGG
ncbi:MAG: CBS domain-containing protein [Thermoanaerobaculia bacterium]|nr:CBS domain-containing protein [Thermoanaerobaculia bacterium]